jgi:hypothetical protein
MASEDIEQSIVINGDATGGVQAIDSTTAAFERFKTKHTELKSVFSERFEHAGLFLFSRQVFGLAGMSELARHVMGVVTLGLDQVAGAAGVATAELAPLLLVVGGSIALFEHFHKGHQDAADSLGQLAKKQGDALKMTDELKDALEKYSHAINALPADLRGLAAAYGALDEVQRRVLMHTEGQLMASSQAQVAALKEQKERTLEAAAALREHMTQLQPWETGYKSAEETLRKYGQRVDDINGKIIESGAQYEKAKADIDAQAAGYANATDKIDKLSKAEDVVAEKQKKAAISAIEMAAARERAEAKRYAHQMEMEAQEAKRQDEALTKRMHFYGISATMAEDLERVEGQAFQSAANGAGRAFAQMAVDGKNFEQGMKQVFKNVEEEFISDIASMMIKWAAFQAITGMGFSFSGGPGAPTNMFTMGAHATGTDHYVDRPTPFIAGEAGLERVTVTPITGASSSRPSSSGSGGGGNTSVSVTVNVSTGADPNAIGQAVIKAIRGQGQLQFVRNT